MKTFKKFLGPILFCLCAAVVSAQTVTNAGSVSPPAGSGGTSDVNVKQINGTTTTTNTGASDGGTIRVAVGTEAWQDLYVTGQAAQTATVNNILTAASGTAATDVTGYKSGSVQVVSTGTGGTFIFEGSNDNVNFQAIPVYSQLILTGTPIIAAIGATASQLIYTFPVQFRYVHLRIATTITGGSIQAFSTFKQSAWTPGIFQVAQGTAANLAVTATVASISTSVIPGTAAANLGKAEDAASASGDTGVFDLAIRQDTLASTITNTNGDYIQHSATKYGALYNFDQEKNLPTYRASANAAPAAACTDLAILPGNATNTVYVTKVTISGIQTTSGQVFIILQKRSTANTVGTSSAMTAVPLDSTDAAASSAPLIYTANPTTGSVLGNVDSGYVSVPAQISLSGVTPYTFNFGERGKGIKLSGTAQNLAVNLSGNTVTGGVIVVTFEWREEP